MPACFQLFPKGSDTPARFSEIDDAMRLHFGAPPDAERYYESWYDIEGLGLAMGFDWDRMRQINPDRAHIIDWLAERYTSDAWTEVGRR